MAEDISFSEFVKKEQYRNIAIFVGVVLAIFFFGRWTSTDSDIEKIDKQLEEFQKKYYEERKMHILYKSLDAGCLQELNEYREEYGIKAP